MAYCGNKLGANLRVSTKFENLISAAYDEGVRGWTCCLVLANRRLIGHVVVHGWRLKTPYPDVNVDLAACGGALACTHPGVLASSNACLKSFPCPRQMAYNRSENKKRRKMKVQICSTKITSSWYTMTRRQPHAEQGMLSTAEQPPRLVTQP